MINNLVFHDITRSRNQIQLTTIKSIGEEKKKRS